MITKEFLLAGNAIFTVSNPEGKHYTFKVKKTKNSSYERSAYFISILTGSDNLNNYTYLGMIIPANGNISLTKASKYNSDSLPYKVASWAVKGIISGHTVEPDGYHIDHAGSCGKCGRALTTPESIKLGLGPVCASKF